MLGKNARIGLIFSRGFLSVNSQPDEAVYPYFPVSAYFQIPLFSSNWFKKKSE